MWHGHDEGGDLDDPGWQKSFWIVKNLYKYTNEFQRKVFSQENYANSNTTIRTMKENDVSHVLKHKRDNQDTTFSIQRILK